MSRRFTGRHMWAVMLGFFGLIIAVNFTMAWLASSTFGGTIVDNSYVASQSFNTWLQAARDQSQLGWQARMGLDTTRHVTIITSQDSATATGIAQHPLGRTPDLPLRFAPAPDGSLRSTAPLPPGRWNLRITVTSQGEQLRLAETLR